MNQLKRQPVFDDLLGKGARIKGHEMPFFDARNSIFATQFDDMSVADLQAHLARPLTPRRSEPLSLRRTPREAHTLVFGGER